MWQSIFDWFIVHQTEVANIAAIFAIISVVFGIAFKLYRHFTSKASAKVMIDVSGDNHQVAGGDQTTTNIGEQIQGDKHIHVTNNANPEFAKFKEELKIKREALQKDLKSTHDEAIKAELNREIADVSQWLLNPQQAYEDYLKTQKDVEALTQRLAALESAGNHDERIAKARQALEKEDYQSAKRLFGEIKKDKRLKESIDVLAESYYGDGLIAALDIQWAKAAENFERAAQLKPSIDNLLQASDYLRRVGRYQKAEVLAKEALILSIKEHGEEHPDTASSYNNLAGNLNDQGQYQAAQPLYEKALKISIDTLGEAHPDTANSYNNLAGNLNKQGDYQAAQPLLEKALKITINTLGEEHPDTALSYNNLAANLKKQGHYKKAQPLFEKALKIRIDTLGKAHPDTALSYNNLGMNLNAQGQYQAAQPLHEKALKISIDTLGEEHPDTAQSYNNVATNLYAQGDYKKAQPLLEKAVRIAIQTLDDHHPDTQLYKRNRDANNTRLEN